MSKYDEDVSSEETQARQRREQALRAITAERMGNAENAASTPPAATRRRQLGRQTSDTRRAPWARRWVPLVLIVALVGVGGLTAYAISALQRQAVQPVGASTVPIPARLTLAPKDANTLCPERLAWSPDSKLIAVQRSACPLQQQVQSPHRFLALFDARTGALLRSFDVTALIRKQLGAADGYSDALSWSSDSTTLVAVISYGHTYGTTNSYHTGLLIQPSAGGTAQILRGPLVSGPSGTPPPVTTSMWNVQTKTSQPIAIASGGILPPALAYRWAGDGQLAVDVPLPDVPGSATGDANAIFSGSPVQQAAGASFPIWQPGYIVPAFARGSDGIFDNTLPPFAYFFEARASLQAPDGHTVMLGQLLGGRLPARSGAHPPTTQQCTSYFDPLIVQTCRARPLPLPDRALAAVLAVAAQGVAFPDGAGGPPQHNYSARVAVTWSPDGTTLAALLPGDSFRARLSTALVTLYDMQTGQQLRQVETLAPPNASAHCDIIIDDPVLSWSPSGKQLALFDTCTGNVTLWGMGTA